MTDWIKCSERMPEDDHIVLVFIPFHDGNWKWGYGEVI